MPYARSAFAYTLSLQFKLYPIGGIYGFRNVVPDSRDGLRKSVTSSLLEVEADSSMPRVALGEGCMSATQPTRVPECLLERGRYSIRVADSYAQRNDAATLIQRLYASRGYRTETVELLLHKSHRITLVALRPPHLLATLTLQFDSYEGLLADALYEKEIDGFRKRGRKVCELCAFAVDPQYSSRELLASLFQTAYICGRSIHHVADTVIEVNPRHAAFYKRMLWFREIGPTRICPRVNAPAVLLHLDLDYLDMQIQNHSSFLKSEEKSLYPHFAFNCRAECLVHRIAQA